MYQVYICSLKSLQIVVVIVPYFSGPLHYKGLSTPKIRGRVVSSARSTTVQNIAIQRTKIGGRQNQSCSRHQPLAHNTGTPATTNDRNEERTKLPRGTERARAQHLQRLGGGSKNARTARPEDGSHGGSSFYYYYLHAGTEELEDR